MLGLGVVVEAASTGLLVVVVLLQSSHVYALDVVLLTLVVVLNDFAPSTGVDADVVLVLVQSAHVCSTEVVVLLLLLVTAASKLLLQTWRSIQELQARPGDTRCVSWRADL